ncbi:hypothetical protein K435DRAFT_68254 [Dendrothele bispora CBS 962.96]|uniref:Uncharacterized protein n=1 Tax=Dendrothele bispora (strain CBS 962.96) TaxID=1314807 RepID=A0A4S8KQS4_DENBC|nr:hypothetical protein K435DRAFT_68254 [Dendrothele bispora CBS 962.96]
MTSLLSDSESSSFPLTYALPPLFASLILAFAGAFLTLDCSHFFTLQYNAISGSFTSAGGKKKFKFIFNGNRSYPKLVPINVSTVREVIHSRLAPPVSPNNFPRLPIKACCARFCRCHRRSDVFACNICHYSSSPPYSDRPHVYHHTYTYPPSVRLPLEPFQRPSLRLVACSTDSFRLVLSIALLARIPAWANVWSRSLLVEVKFGVGREQKNMGLIPVFVCFSRSRSTSDYVWRIFGECPDETSRNIQTLRVLLGLTVCFQILSQLYR